MYWSKYTLFFCFLALLSCGHANERAVGNGLSEAFDLKTFFENEIERLSKDATYRLVQKISIDGEEEVTTSSDPNWSSILRPFIDSDINKTAWLENYVLEESLENGNKVLNYKSSIQKMKTQQLRIVFNGQSDSVASVSVENQDNNFILSSTEDLFYNKAEVEFSIEKTQQYFFFAPQKIIFKGSRKR